ncbi:MAG: hypothetical protein H6872_02955 [Methylobacteriaceae bacterium]|nr:hypothetical protein [Rhodoblastus sp.]MCC0004146.1 hypothetical protein [Methylobacteriaceae bacterium]
MSELPGPTFPGLRSKFSGLAKPVQIAISLVLIVFVAAGLFWLFNEAIFYFTARGYVDEIAWVFNVNRHLASAMTLVLFLVLAWFGGKAFSLNSANRRVGVAGIFGLLIANSLILWAGSRNANFERSGAAAKCYVLSRAGQVKYLENTGIDPETGRACKPYTADMLERLKSYEGGKRPERVTDDNPVFFDPRSGRPVLWYAKGKAGEVELFNLMGFHPDTGEELQSVSADVANAYKLEVAERNRRAPTLVDLQKVTPFDPVSGRARVWYWKSSGGEYEFYDNRGFHPRTGEALQPITREVLADHEQKQSHRCYVVTRDSVRYGREPGVDPQTGRMCRQLTAGLLERVREYEKGNRPKAVTSETPTFFDQRTGDPALWYSQDSSGNLKLFDLMGFDPQTGDELQPVTREIPDKWGSQVARRKAEDARRNRPPQPVDPDKFPFFDPATGAARVWYWRSPEGRYEFFDNQGFHPRTGEPLSVITRDAISAWRKETQLQIQRAREAEALRVRQQHESEERAEAARRAQEESARRVAQSGDMCDQAAANPNDRAKPQSVPGVRYEELKAQAGSAAEICKLAVENNPGQLRYQYQYARALGFSNPDRAIAIYRQLTRQKYPAAYDNLANLLLRKNNIAGAIAVVKEGAQLDDPDSLVTLADLVEKGHVQVADPQAFKFALLSRAARQGHQGAQLAVEQERVKIEQNQQQQALQQQQQQMMLNMFGTILQGVGAAARH